MKCIIPGCEEKAGTPTGKYWCPRHDQERMQRITEQMEKILREWPKS